MDYISLQTPFQLTRQATPCALVESSRGKHRDERLDQPRFYDLAEARTKFEFFA